MKLYNGVEIPEIGFGPGGMGGGTPPERPDGAPGGGFDPGASGRGDTPPAPPQG